MYNLITYGELQCSIGEWEVGRRYFCMALRLKPNDLRALWLLTIALTKCKKQQGYEVLTDLASETKRRLTDAYSQLKGEASKAAGVVLASVA